jgi:hypothetical protein
VCVCVWGGGGESYYTLVEKMKKAVESMSSTLIFLNSYAIKVLIPRTVIFCQHVEAIALYFRTGVPELKTVIHCEQVQQ